VSFKVRLTREAETDLFELYDFLVDADIDAAEKALAAIRKGIEVLELFPFACRKAQDGGDPTLRELVITVGRAGYVALFRITDSRTVTVLAVRHQREDDFH
jgi:plasmid stabilization system protein ParE